MTRFKGMIYIAIVLIFFILVSIVLRELALDKKRRRFYSTKRSLADIILIIKNYNEEFGTWPQKLENVTKGIAFSEYLSSAEGNSRINYFFDGSGGCYYNPEKYILGVNINGTMYPVSLGGILRKR